MDPEIKELNVEEAVDSISNDLFPAAEQAEPEGQQAESPEGAEPIEAEQAEQVEARPPPKSWAKEAHELWSKIPPEAQAQIEHREKQMLEGLEQYKGDSGLGKQMREIVSPYEPLLRSQNIDTPKAVTALMNAHYKLSTLQGEQKLAYFNQIAQTYGIDLGMKQAPDDPKYAALERELAEIKNHMTESQRQVYEQQRGKVTNDVNSFAEATDEKGNKLHPYFDEVSGDIIAQIQAGAELKDAYDKAVWANPTTRAKEQARALKEHEKQLREKSTAEARSAQRAASTNVRSRDTKRSPTEPLGKMEDTMSETLAEIRSRAH